MVTVAVIAVALVSASAFAFLFTPMKASTAIMPPATTGTQPTTNPTALTIGDASAIAQNYVAQIGDSNLAVKEVDQYSQCFYAQVIEKNTGVGAFELTINNNTGAVATEQGAMNDAEHKIRALKHRHDGLPNYGNIHWDRRNDGGVLVA